LESQEKKLIADIKKHAKLNQMVFTLPLLVPLPTQRLTPVIPTQQGAVKIMAKDLVRTRNYITRFIEMKTHLNAVSLKMQVCCDLVVFAAAALETFANACRPATTFLDCQVT
jgi:charged multivesicular body protein 2A